jgi:hypothetical protein
MVLTTGEYKAEINLNFGQLGSIIQWCELNCVAEWGYMIKGPAGSEQGEYDFYFSSRTDYINFNLFKK